LPAVFTAFAARRSRIDDVDDRDAVRGLELPASATTRGCAAVGRSGKWRVVAEVEGL